MLYFFQSNCQVYTSYYFRKFWKIEVPARCRIFPTRGQHSIMFFYVPCTFQFESMSPLSYYDCWYFAEKSAFRPVRDPVNIYLAKCSVNGAQTSYYLLSIVYNLQFIKQVTCESIRFTRFCIFSSIFCKGIYQVPFSYLFFTWKKYKKINNVEQDSKFPAFLE